MAAKPSVQLVLRSADINLAARQYSGSNLPLEPIGGFVASDGSQINRWRTQMVFAGINWQDVLGDLYKVGGKYEMTLHSIVSGLSSNGTLYTTVESNRTFNIFMRGMRTMRSYVNGRSVDEVKLATIRIGSGGIGQIHNVNTSFTFKILEGQQNQVSNLEIQFRDFLLDSIEPTPTNFTVALPNTQFTFFIRPIDD